MAPTYITLGSLPLLHQSSAMCLLHFMSVYVYVREVILCVWISSSHLSTNTQIKTQLLSTNTQIKTLYKQQWLLFFFFFFWGEGEEQQYDWHFVTCLMLFVSQVISTLVRQIHSRDSRRPFCVHGHWLAPNISMQADKVPHWKIICWQWIVK